ETADPGRLRAGSPSLLRAQLDGRLDADLDPSATVATLPHTAHDPVDQEHRNTDRSFPLTTLVQPDPGLRSFVDDRVTRVRADDVAVVLRQEAHRRRASPRHAPLARELPRLAPFDDDRARFGLERSQKREKGRGFHSKPPRDAVERRRPIRPEEAADELALGFLRIQARPLPDPPVRANEGYVRADARTEAHL